MLTSPVAITNTHSVGVVRDALVAAAVEAAGHGPRSRGVVAARRRGDVRRPAQRHERLPRPGGARCGGARLGDRRPGCRGRRRRRHRIGLPRVQGRDRDGLAGHPGRARRPHGRRPGPGQLRQARLAAGGRRAGRRGDRHRRGPQPVRRGATALAQSTPPPGSGSIIVVVATDAPLLPHQCQRLAQRAGLGIARAGGTGGHTSGDLFIAFATGNRLPTGIDDQSPLDYDVRAVGDRVIDALFDGVIEATEEAIVNALVAATTMVGRDGVTAHALPHDRLLETMARYGRGTQPA